MEPRRNTDFRGTIPYASLHAHNKEELSRRDDIWSFFFMMLEFFDEQLSWKQSKATSFPFCRLKQRPSPRVQDEGLQEPQKAPLSDDRKKV
jgi:hypothetical protein